MAYDAAFIELRTLAEKAMASPFVSVTKNKEGVWKVTVTNFDKCEGFELHGGSREVAIRNACGVLTAWSSE